MGVETGDRTTESPFAAGRLCAIPAGAVVRSTHKRARWTLTQRKSLVVLVGVVPGAAQGAVVRLPMVCWEGSDHVWWWTQVTPELLAANGAGTGGEAGRERTDRWSWPPRRR